MAEQVFGLTRGQQARIGRVVSDAERQRTPQRKNVRSETSRPTQGFWIELIAAGTGDDAHFYSWKKVHPAPADLGGWIDADPPATGTLNAREASETVGLYMPSVPKRFYAQFIGYDALDVPQYLFVGFDPGLGQYQGMDYTTVTQQSRGWDFDRGVAIPSV